MASISFREIKKGSVIMLEGEPYEVLDRSFRAKQQREAMATVSMRNLLNGKVLEKNFQSSAMVEQAPEEALPHLELAARQPGAHAWYVLDQEGLDQRVRGRSVAEIVALAPAKVDPSELPFDPPAGARTAVRVSPGITHTIGGLRIDEHARVAGADGLFAAGADVGGISTGGYASGLAAALVFGRIAAETALSR
jgi:translation elongation factor P/translation initiation factor 5A